MLFCHCLHFRNIQVFSNSKKIRFSTLFNTLRMVNKHTATNTKVFEQNKFDELHQQQTIPRGISSKPSLWPRSVSGLGQMAGRD